MCARSPDQAATRHPIDEDIGRIIAADRRGTSYGTELFLVTGRRASPSSTAYMVETLAGTGTTSVRRTFVIGLVRNRAKAETSPRASCARSALPEQDVSQPPPTNRSDVNVHAASLCQPEVLRPGDPVGTMTANVLGMHHLLESARRDGARFLYFSSGEVYGTVPPEAVPIKETTFGQLDPADVRSCYGESKRAAETFCVSFARQYGVSTVIVRPFHTYGPGFALDDGRVFADFVADVVAGRDIVLQSEGLARRAFCYLADATIGFFTALLKGVPGTPYNVGDEGGELSIRELAELIVGLFPEKGLKVVRAASQDRPVGYLESSIPRNAPDTSRLRALGWRSTTSVADGFRRTIRSYQ
ncbi:MAG: NAD-dependent epimerase/dehydratase family protein [Gemmataceae bacterium]